MPSILSLHVETPRHPGVETEAANFAHLPSRESLCFLIDAHFPSADTADMVSPGMFEASLLAELNMGLPPTSFFKLLAEPNDWSFVLKLHAMLEGALVRLLERRFPEEGPDERTNFVEKVRVAFELPEVSRDQKYQGFYFALNFVRNRFAHNAKYIYADLRTVLAEIPPYQLPRTLRSLGLTEVLSDEDRFTSTFGELALGQVENASNREKFEELRRLLLRANILYNACYLLETISLAYYIQRRKDGKSYGEDFRPQLQDLLNDPAVIAIRRKYFAEDESAE